MSNVSSIDDLLAGVGNSQQPATPEHKEKIQEQAELADDMEQETYEDTDSEPEGDSVDSEEEHHSSDDDEPSQNDKSDGSDEEVDDYGNKKERMSKGMKERLDRKEKQYQNEVAQRDYEIQQLRQKLSGTGASNEVQQAVKDFQYDPNDESGWQQQLTDFVKHTVTNMHVEQQTQQQKANEQKLEQQFKEKFTAGMDRFSDFREVVGKQPMDDAMTLALRGMNDPSAFIYAVSKRQPGELERISKIPDSYARMVEMGKLEERMRRNKPATKTPRPLGRHAEDAAPRVTPKQKDMSGDDLLAKADAKRLNTVRARHKGNR
jgi:hypothetical protein